MSIRGALALAAFLVGGCVTSSSPTCADGQTCRSGTTCVALGTEAAPNDVCVSPDQLTACSDVDDATACTVGGKAGTCFHKACVVAACGDGLIDVTEACDDGGNVDKDGCSADCKSNEQCGNGFTDLVTAEECDDANLKLSGDGCSTNCKLEYRLWRDVTPAGPPVRAGYGLVTDLDHGVLMFGGGTYGAAQPYDTDNAKFADTWRWDGNTWIDLRPATSPPRRSHPSLAYDGRRARIVMFGGFNQSGGAVSDTWEWDGVAWHDRTPPSTTPGPHSRSDAALACTDTECVMFGGAKTGGLTFHADTWQWDGATWTENTTAVHPSARRSARMAYDKLNHRLVLFGGEVLAGTTYTELFDTWTYEGGVWSSRNLGTTGPQPTETPTMAWDETANRMVLIGQANTWYLDASYQWHPLFSPPALKFPVIAWDHVDARLLAVGQSLAGNAMAMAVQDNAWFSSSDLHPFAGPGGIAAAYDAHRGVVVAFDPVQGTFEWNGIGWKLTAPRTPLPGSFSPLASDAALAHHRGCDVTLEFGGRDTSGTRLDETWRYGLDATMKPTWTRILGVLPAPRMKHSMTYDSTRDVVLMFGGRLDVGMFSNELWQLTSVGCAPGGWTWTQLAMGQSIAPSARAAAAIAFDEKRGVAVLFGGHDAGLVDLADTWEWNGSAWIQRTPTTSPPARSDHAMAYDPRRGRVILFGGHVDGDATDDAWEWDGEAGTWLRLSPASLPAARADHTLVPDITGGLLAVGGSTNAATDPDERLSSELSTQPRETCIDATLDLDGDGLHGCADPDCWTRCAPTCAPGASCPDRCGDGACNAPVEDYLICPVDCPPP